MEPTFDTLARQHRRALYAAARRCSANAEDAEDLTQEALCLAYRYFHQFQPGTNFAAWAGRIVTRLAIRRYHQRSRRPEIVSVEDLPPQWEDGLPAPPDDDLHPEQHLLARVADETVRSHIQALPEPFQRVMLLSCLEELPYEEISHRLRIPIGTVRSRLSRGRRLLRTALSSLYTVAEAGPSARAHTGLAMR
jgi:RNA polymerase sigma-70 factor (ECF subfamily)